MRALVLAPTVVLLASAVAAFAQLPAAVPGTIYRVFLSSGEPLPSFGEPVFVGDRVIFNLLLGGGTPAEMQLVSLPAAGVDRERTERYIEAMRAEHYAATRGEADYAALTAEVARVLDQLTTLTDVQTRLRLAEGARRQLLAWAEAHYHYRADDIRELASLFDEVIAELRIAAGEPAVELALIAPPPPREPLLPAPTLRESVALALSAAELADNGAERIGILSGAARAAGRMGDPVVEQTVSELLQEEISAGSAYAALLSALRTRAEAARERGDVAAVARLLDELERRDAQLGRRRPAEVAALRRDLESTIDAVKAFQAALASHKRQLAAARTYERRLAPLFDRFDSLEEHLTTLKEMGGITPGQISLAEAELLRIAQELDGIRPPESLAGVHTAFGNVVRLAQEAFARRRQARSSRSNEMREASAAAAGAMLLIEQVRADLAASLEPPVLP